MSSNQTPDRFPLPWSYQPVGDSDGEHHGIDHYVMAANGEEVAVMPTERTATLTAAAGDLLAACRAALLLIDIRTDAGRSAYLAAHDAIRKATGGTLSALSDSRESSRR